MLISHLGKWPPLCSGREVSTAIHKRLGWPWLSTWLDGATQLDHESSDLINGFVPWWILNAAGPLWGWWSSRGGEGVSGWRKCVVGTCLWRVYLSLPPSSLLPGHCEVSSPATHSCSGSNRPGSPELEASYIRNPNETFSLGMRLFR